MSSNNTVSKVFNEGVFKNNPTFVQTLGMCPTLAVTTSAINGFGMGVSTLFVLAMSNIAISILARFIPDKVRIPAYIVVIAGFVTVLEFILQAYFPALNAALGVFVPLIAVNCIVLARAEIFASKNGPLISGFDGISMGLGFTLGLTTMGIIRELVGAVSFFGIVLHETFPRTVIMILPGGAFVTLAFIIAFLNLVKGRKTA